MKQQRFSWFSIYPLLFMFILSGCSKQSPAADTGLLNFQTTNPGGSTGNAGSAAVIYSKWDSSFSGMSAIWSVPQLTKNILDSAVVLVYFRNGNTVSPLNYTDGDFFLKYTVSVGQINLSASDCLTEYPFQYVIIPGAAATSGSGAVADYRSLSRAYNILQY